jgi:hypothetical protein
MNRIDQRRALSIAIMSMLACTPVRDQNANATFASSPQATPQPTPSASSLPSSTALRRINVNGWIVKPRQYRAVSHSLKYSITGEYPFIVSRDYRAVRLNREINTRIARQYAYAMHPTRKDFYDRGAFSNEDPLETAEFTYEILFARDGLLSIRFHDMTYSAGAAHPLENYFSLNFDLKRIAIVPISSLFRPKLHFMRRLVDLCQKRFDEEGVFTFPDAIEAELHRHIEWNITREGLVVNFDRCSVMACAYGERAVRVPYDDFGNLLNRKGLLGHILSD